MHFVLYPEWLEAQYWPVYHRCRCGKHELRWSMDAFWIAWDRSREIRPQKGLGKR